jgi:exopolyphosphatase/guanosine-5'-triphosphate,3'-diphosphate pyrophosphatase
VSAGDASGSPVAAIDLGTNSVLLLIARGSAGALEVLEDHCRMPRLGEGVARRGRLGDEALERTLLVLGDYAVRIAARRVAPADVRAVGTAVLRRAADPERLLDRARAEHGLAIEIASEDEEAALGYRAVAGAAEAAPLVLDVGGGSTELVWNRGSERRSVPAGAVVLSEEHGHAGAFDASGWSALVAAARAAVAAFPANAAADADVVVIGGSACNLANLIAGTSSFDAGVADGRVFTRGEAEHWAQRLAELDVSARRALPIEAERAAILPAGLALVAAALARLGVARARTSVRGLRHGDALALLERRAR